MEIVVDASVSGKKTPSSPSNNNTAAREADNESKMGAVGSRSHEKDLDRPFGGTDDRGGTSGTRGETVGPTKRYSYSSGVNEVVLGSIKRDDGLESLGGVLADEKLRANSQPFDIFVPASYIRTAPPYQSPGMGFPFTHAQWQELNRQAMIYKYMISSVPVPHNLLFPLSRNAVDSSASSVHSLKYPRNGSDPEPGRCKRTDGKKWRCSRDVAPQQKYCERHLHRGRPRSRKRVEAKLSNAIDEPNKKTRLHQQNAATLPKSTRNYSSQQQQLVGANEDNLSLLFNARTDLTTPSSYKGPAHRNLGLMMMMGAENTVEEPNIESGNMGLSSIYGPSNDLMLYNNHDYYYTEQQHQNHSLDLLSHFKYSASEIESPISLIEAWPVDHNSSNSLSHKEPSLSPPNYETISSSLTLSMAIPFGDALDYGEMGKIQVENDGHNHYNYPKTEDSKWLMGPNSWEPFALGGPLAEALQPGSVATLGCSDPTSPPHQDSTQVGTTVSSPSGVLHRTLFSLSDNSSCNSPTLAAAAAQPSEIAVRWLN